MTDATETPADDLPPTADEPADDQGAVVEDDDGDPDEQDTPAEAIADAREISEQAADARTRVEAADAVDVAEAHEQGAVEDDDPDEEEDVPDGDGDDEPGPDLPVQVPL